jgi:hypothetical protein
MLIPQFKNRPARQLANWFMRLPTLRPNDAT